MGDVPASDNAASICGGRGYLAPVTWSAPAQALALARELAATGELGNMAANPHLSHRLSWNEDFASRRGGRHGRQERVRGSVAAGPDR